MSRRVCETREILGGSAQSRGQAVGSGTASAPVIKCGAWRSTPQVLLGIRARTAGCLPPIFLWTRQLRCTSNLAFAGAAARVQGKRRAGGTAGVATALGPGPNCICAHRAGCALGQAVGANRYRGSLLVLIARAPIRRGQFHGRGLLVEVTCGRELDWVALGIRRRRAEAYRLQDTRRRAARQGNSDSENSKEENGKAVLSHGRPPAA